MKFLRKQSIRQKLSLVFFIIALIFITFALMKSWNRIPKENLQFNVRYLIIALLFTPILTAGISFLWLKILNLLKSSPSFICIWRANMYSALMRYIPGKIWNFIGKIHWVSKSGTSEKKVLFSTLIDLLFLCISSVFVSLYTVKLFLPQQAIVLITLFTIIILVCIHPKIMQKGINIIGKVSKKIDPTTMRLDFTYSQILTLTLLYCVMWILMGIQLYIFILSFYPLEIKYLPVLISINAASWLIGYVSIIAPSGIGIKEGVLVYILQSYIPSSMAIIIAILLRLFQILTEIIMAGVLLCFDSGAWKNLFNRGKNNVDQKKS